VNAGFYPAAIEFSPDGGSAYVANSISNTVSQYDVGAGGQLTAKTPPTVQAGTGPDGVVVSPDGLGVYVPNYTTNNVSQFDIGAGGRLTPKTPAAIGAGTSPGAAAITPDGRSVYVGNTEDGTVSQYDVGAGGRLVGKPTQPTVAAGQLPQGIALMPNQGPVAGFGVTVGPAGSPSQFDASASRDPDGNIGRYDWNFGDGAQGPNAGPNPQHQYAAPGNYTVTLTVADAAGCSMSFVFTGQTAICNGGAAARTTGSLTVPPTSSSSLTVPPTSSGSGSTPKPPAKADLRRSGKTIRVDRKGRFRFDFRGTPRLQGTAAFSSTNELRVGRRKAFVTLARKSFRVPVNGKVNFRIRLSSENLRLLKRNHKIRARVTVELKNAAGLSSTASKIVTFKAPS
jgi:PKD repeat protein